LESNQYTMNPHLSSNDEQSWTGVHLLTLESALEALDWHSDNEAAAAWLAASGILTPPGGAHMVRLVADWSFNVAPHHDRAIVFCIADGAMNTMAFPVLAGGEVVDVLLISADEPRATAMMFGGAPWLGRDELAGSVVRLHANPIDWLRAGCTGACHVGDAWPPAEFYLLEDAETIHCAELETALWAWRWAFDGNETSLDRFDVYDTPERIRTHFQRQAVRSAVRTVGAA
jgi:hypothetical protein